MCRSILALFAAATLAVVASGCGKQESVLDGLPQYRDTNPVFEGSIPPYGQVMRLGPNGIESRAMPLQLVTNNGRYDLVTTRETVLISLPSRNWLTWETGQDTRYRVHGRIAADRPVENSSSVGVIIATTVEYVRRPNAQGVPLPEGLR